MASSRGSPCIGGVGAMTAMCASGCEESRHSMKMCQVSLVVLLEHTCLPACLPASYAC